VNPNCSGPPVVLQIDELTFGYPQRPLFSQLTTSICAGLNLVRGGEGRGKTTLLRLLSGELVAQAGSLRINGMSLATDANAYCQQVFRADPRADSHDKLTPLQYFDSLRSRFPAFPAAAEPHLLELLDGLGLSPHLHKSMYMLSTGSKRKVWIAAALAAGANLTLLDEPFAALDTVSVAFLIERLRTANGHRSRALVIADYEAPANLAFGQIIDLGD
jgi:ABC-type multidrug transport system ATPase subunit